MPLLNALLIWAVLGQGATTPPQSPATENRADSSRDAGAILQARCFVCHGAGQQMNGLRLDRREDALRGSNSGPVIVPGKSGESKLIQHGFRHHRRQDHASGRAKTDVGRNRRAPQLD